MYAIANVCYGYPLTDKELADLVENGEFEGIPGFNEYYSGFAAVPPAMFGVRLFKFDECSDYIIIDSYQWTPNNEQINQFNIHWEKLVNNYPELAQEIKNIFDSPKIFILWSTS